MAETPMFAYGTLRPHDDIGWNRRGNMPQTRAPLMGVRVRGAIYDHGYPVAKLDEDGWIIGDVLFFDGDIPEWIDRMERGVGYVLRTVTVFDAEGNEVMKAKVWHYRYRPRGELIESGDFLQHQLRD